MLLKKNFSELEKMDAKDNVVEEVNSMTVRCSRKTQDIAKRTYREDATAQSC
jgi:hypothetical protein